MILSILTFIILLRTAHSNVSHHDRSFYYMDGLFYSTTIQLSQGSFLDRVEYLIHEQHNTIEKPEDSLLMSSQAKHPTQGTSQFNTSKLSPHVLMSRPHIKYYQDIKNLKGNISLQVLSLSFDSTSNLLLMQTAAKDQSRFTLLIGSLCGKLFSNYTLLDYSDLRDRRDTFENILKLASSEVNVKNKGHNLKSKKNDLHDNNIDTESKTNNFQQSNLNHQLVLLYKEAKSLDFAKIGPFAIHDKKIFFVLQKFDLSDIKLKTNVIEIRELHSKCRDGSELEYPILATDSLFDLLECSTHVSEIVKERYVGTNSFRPLDVLLVVPDKQVLYFFIQILKISNISSTDSSKASSFIESIVQLYAVSNRSQNFGVIYEKFIDSYYFKFLLNQLGGLSYKNKCLCWAAIDHIVCGRWINGQLSGVRTHLETGKASDVCEVSETDPPLANLITGISIAKMEFGGELEIYFGCLAQTENMGGLGFVRSNEKKELVSQVFKISNENVTIRAGSMLYVEKCFTVARSSASVVVGLVGLRLLGVCVCLAGFIFIIF